MEKTSIIVENYGDMIAKINDQDLVSFETDGGYQGDYLAITTDGKRLFYYIDSYGSCSGCDWLEAEGDYVDGHTRVDYKKALEYVGGIKPKFIVPKDEPLKYTMAEYSGFKFD